MKVEENLAFCTHCMKRQRAVNVINTTFGSNVKKQVINGLVFTAVSTIGALTTNFLNTILQEREMNGRSFGMVVMPNPNLPTNKVAGWLKKVA